MPHDLKAQKGHRSLRWVQLLCSSLWPLNSAEAPQPEGPKLWTGSWAPSHSESATTTGILETGPLPAVNANKLQVLLGVAQILFAVPFLHDGFECVFIISTYCWQWKQSTCISTNLQPALTAAALDNFWKQTSTFLFNLPIEAGLSDLFLCIVIVWNAHWKYRRTLPETTLEKEN